MPPPTQTGTLVLNETDPRLGDFVTFTADFPHQLKSKNVRVQIMAYQDGALVFGSAAAHDEPQQLGGGSSDWFEKGGPATCVATLYYWTYSRVQEFHRLAEITFEAGDRLAQ